MSDAAEQLHRVADRFAKESQPTHFLFWFVPSLAKPVSSLKDRCFASLPLDPATKLVLATRFGDQQFQLELPGRYFGLAQDSIPVFAYLVWIGPRGLWRELFSLAAGAFTQGRQHDPEFWLRRLVEEAFFNPSDPMVRFSSGPSIMDNDQMFDLWAVLEGLSGATNLPEDVAAQIGALPIPWILRAEHARPFMASEFLCRRYADRLQQKAASQGVGGAAEPKRPEAAFVFRRDGDGWFIRAFGQQGHFRNLKGFGYIARLLQNPGAPIPMAQLDGAVDRTETPSRVSEGHILEDSLSVQFQPVQDVLADQEAIENYQREIAEYLERIAEAERMGDPTTAGVLRNELNALLEHRNQVVGLGGKRRYFQGETDKARIAVHNVLRYAYKKLREGNMEHLAKHLEVAISFQAGGFIYEPIPGVSWEVKD